MAVTFEKYIFVLNKYNVSTGWWFAHGTLQDTFAYTDTKEEAKRTVSLICESPRKVVQAVYHSSSTGLDYTGEFYYCGKALEGGDSRNIQNLKDYRF